ncbi:hypothetical protein SODG_005039 [Sodalis praecaptivus]
MIIILNSVYIDLKRHCLISKFYATNFYPLLSCSFRANIAAFDCLNTAMLRLCFINCSGESSLISFGNGFVFIPICP